MLVWNEDATDSFRIALAVLQLFSPEMLLPSILELV